MFRKNPRRSSQIDTENPTGGRAVVRGPSRVNAGVATDHRSVVHRETVRIGGTGGEVRGLEHLPGRRFVPDQAGASLGVIMTVISGDQPDGAVIPCDAVVARPSGNTVERDEE